jgi:YfiH family protein
VARLGPADVVFTDRHGGVSHAPYDSLNLADHVGDDPRAVAENRRRIARRVEGLPHDPDDWVWLHQVHGSIVVRADDAGVSGADADAVVTTRAGLPLVILVADCVPVALATDRAVGAVHAGWKGLEAGVIANAVSALGTGDVRALLGPCINACHYAFGDDDLARLTTRFGPQVASQTVDGHRALDLPAAVVAALDEAGVTDVKTMTPCTAHSDSFFSHRRDGPTGRQAMIVVKTT